MSGAAPSHTDRCPACETEYAAGQSACECCDICIDQGNVQRAGSHTTPHCFDHQAGRANLDYAMQALQKLDPNTADKIMNLLHHYAEQAKDFERHGGDLENHQAKRKDDSEATTVMHGLRIASE